MTMLAGEAAAAAESSAGASAATSIGKGAKSARASKGAPGPKPARRTSPGTPTQRRATVSKSVNVGKSSYSSYQGSQGRRHTSVHLKAPTWMAGGGGKVSTLMVEWLIGVAFIIWAAFDGKKSYQGTVQNFFWRFFSWSMVFFVLALVMRGKNSGRVAVLFGALLDVAIVIYAAASGSISALDSLFKGQGTNPTSNAPANATTPPASASVPGAAAPTTNPIVNTATRDLARAAHIPESLAADLLNNPVGQFINPLTNPLTKPVIDFFKGLF
jgi:hypothetical protein